MFAKIAQKLFGNSDKFSSRGSDSKLREELRNHYRYKPWHSGMVTVTDNKGTKLNCFDISYGGIGIDTPRDSNPSEIDKVTINAAGTHCTITTQIAHTAPDYTGYTFIHETGESLLFLRGILEFMRCGSTLKRISNEHLKQEKQDDNGFVWRGDGPSDLTNQAGRFSLTFRDGNQYLSITSDGKTLKTVKTDASEANASDYVRDKTTPDARPDKDTLTKALFLLSAIQDEQCQQLIGNFVDLISDQLSTTAIY